MPTKTGEKMRRFLFVMRRIGIYILTIIVLVPVSYFVLDLGYESYFSEKPKTVTQKIFALEDTFFFGESSDLHAPSWLNLNERDWMDAYTHRKDWNRLYITTEKDRTGACSDLKVRWWLTQEYGLAYVMGKTYENPFKYQSGSWCFDITRKGDSLVIEPKSLGLQNAVAFSLLFILIFFAILFCVRAIKKAHLS